MAVFPLRSHFLSIYDNKQQINHRVIEKVGHLHNEIFHFIHCHTLLILLYHLPCAMLLKITKYSMRKKNIFVYVAASEYLVMWKEVENRILRNHIFRDICMCKQPNIDKVVEVNIFVFSYFRYTDRLLDVLFLFSVVILSELHQKSRRKDPVTKKRFLFGCIQYFLCYFLLFSVHSLFSSTPILRRNKIYFLPENNGGRLKPFVECQCCSNVSAVDY